MKIYNNNPDFGDAGPHEAASFEALADEMDDHFALWARENLFELNDENYPDDEIAWLDAECARLRAEFIAGLEEVD